MNRKFFIYSILLIASLFFTGCIGSMMGGSSFYVTRHDKIVSKTNSTNCNKQVKRGGNEAYYFLLAEYEPTATDPRLVCKSKDDFLANKSSTILYATTTFRDISAKETTIAKNVPIWGYFANDNNCSNAKTNVILSKPKVFRDGEVLINLYMKQSNVNSVPLGKYKNILRTIGNFATGGMINTVSNMIDLMNNQNIETVVSDFAKSTLSNSSALHDKTIKFNLQKGINEYIYPISLCNEDCAKANKRLGNIHLKLKKIKTLTKYQKGKDCVVDFSRVNALYDVERFLKIKIGSQNLKALILDTSMQMDDYRKESFFRPLFKLEHKLRDHLTDYDIALILYLTLNNTKRYRSYANKVNDSLEYYYNIEEKDFDSLGRLELKKIKSNIKKEIKNLRFYMRPYRNQLIETYMPYFEEANIKLAYIEAQSLIKRYQGLMSDNVNERSTKLQGKMVSLSKMKNRLRRLSANGFYSGSENNIFELFDKEVMVDNPNFLVKDFHPGKYKQREIVNLLVNKLEKEKFGCFYDLKSKEGVMEGFINRAEELDGYFQGYRVISLYQDKDKSIGMNNGYMLILFDFTNDNRGWPKISKLSIKSINSISKDIIKEKMQLWGADSKCKRILGAF